MIALLFLLQQDEWTDLLIPDQLHLYYGREQWGGPEDGDFISLGLAWDLTLRPAPLSREDLLWALQDRSREGISPSSPLTPSLASPPLQEEPREGEGEIEPLEPSPGGSPPQSQPGAPLGAVIGTTIGTVVALKYGPAMGKLAGSVLGSLFRSLTRSRR